MTAVCLLQLINSLLGGDNETSGWIHVTHTECMQATLHLNCARWTKYLRLDLMKIWPGESFMTSCSDIFLHSRINWQRCSTWSEFTVASQNMLLAITREFRHRPEFHTCLMGYNDEVMTFYFQKGQVLYDIMMFCRKESFFSNRRTQSQPWQIGQQRVQYTCGSTFWKTFDTCPRYPGNWFVNLWSLV